jgi:hypothetical protein
MLPIVRRHSGIVIAIKVTVFKGKNQIAPSG